LSPDQVPEGLSYLFAVDGTDSNGNLKATVYPRLTDIPPGVPTIGTVANGYEVDFSRKQDRLVNATDVLKVPPLPVFTLATALASRERGETGGTATSELFAIADRYLSDAIAYDTALYANEMDWFVEEPRWVRTNVRGH